ncbi:MAG: hypothetical protein K6C14_00925 [Eubacterium sp.]|nr:hypothetical protein [Eubacterium sp.]
MDNYQRINIKDAPKGFKLLLILLPAVGYFLLSPELDNDFFFLYKTGEYIVNSGFPFKDFLSMHTNMDIVVQQWLTDVIFYELYSRLSLFGIGIFIFVCYTVYAFFTYKLCRLICDNWFFAALCALLSDIFIAVVYMATRPHALSLTLFVIELFALESFIKTKKKGYLVIIPFVSLLLINVHAAMWPLMFVFAGPYALQALPFKFKKIRQTPVCSFPWLAGTGIISLALGFVNPYGVKAMAYVFTSFGYKEINILINEMKPTSLDSSFGALFFAQLIILVAVIAATRFKSFSLRHVLLFGGTVLLALMNIKSIGLFFALGVPAYSYYFNGADFSIRLDSTPSDPKKRKLRAALCVIAGALCAVMLFIAATYREPTRESLEEYKSLDKAVDYLEKEEGEITLFTGFDYGQYLEYKGFHPYIDGRAEIFLKDNNHEYDYLKEYVLVTRGYTNYREFTDKYGFNYLIVRENEPALYSGLLYDDDYEQLYKGKDFILFRLKG